MVLMGAKELVIVLCGLAITWPHAHDEQFIARECFRKPLFFGERVRFICSIDLKIWSVKPIALPRWQHVRTTLRSDFVACRPRHRLE